jgi:acetyltransferase-like isoleucine patch superfamily enzyme
VSGLRSSFAKPLVHQPPGVHEPFRLFVIRVCRAVLNVVPKTWVKSSPRLTSLAERLEMGDLWRTDVMAWRLRRARQMGIKVGERCRLYSLNVVSEAELVEIGDGVIVSGEVMFVTHDGAVFTALEKFPEVNGCYGRIRIGNDCFLGIRAIIMPGVELGDNCVVAGGAVVMDSFGPNSVIAGNPAKYVCPTSIYLELKRHSPATIYDGEYPFPLKLPPELLASRMAGVPFKAPRPREGTPPVKRPAMRAMS